MAKSKSKSKSKSKNKKQKLATRKKEKKASKNNSTKAKALANNEEVSSDSDNDPLCNPDELQKLLEPYSKSQLIDFITDAALKDSALFARIRESADRDVSHRKIFVHGLGWDTTRATLLSAFQSYGEIEECNVVTDRVTGKAKGYGFVLFKTRQGASKALKQQQKKINNRIVSFQLASVGPVPQQNQEASGRKVYVSNVQADADPEKLKALFSKFGEIETGPIGFDMMTGKSRGFALFVYKTQEGANKALEEPFKMFEGHRLHCQRATEGKNKAPLQSAQTPVLAAVAAAQNLMFSQQAGLNPAYAGLVANPNAGLITGSVNSMAGGINSSGVISSSQMAQVGQLGASPLGSAAGSGGYSAASHGLGSLGGSHSLLGAYGSAAPSLGLQHMHSNSQHMFSNSQLGHGQLASSRVHGSGGSFSGYPPYM